MRRHCRSGYSTDKELRIDPERTPAGGARG
jgi:hypothetical protein